MSAKLLTSSQKENIKNYKYSVVDNSLTSKYLKKHWEYFQGFFPDYVAPNVISLTGLIITLYGWDICNTYYVDRPYVSCLLTVLCLFTYLNLDAIDGIHARKTKNSSPVGEIIDHGCDSVSAFFIGLIVFKFLYIINLNILWYLTIPVSMGFSYAHLMTLVNPNLQFGKYTGPSEIILYVCALMTLKTFGIGSVYLQYFSTCLSQYSTNIFCCVFCVTLYHVNFIIRKKYPYTANGVSLVYIVLMLKGYLLDEPTLLSVIADNMIIATMTCDIIISKMAKKNLSQWIIVIALVSQLSNIIGIIISLFFVTFQIYEIADYMNIPILSTNINIYCSGVFDLCHAGHIKMFENSLQFGNKLYVGVHNDEAVKSYKREPIKNHEERCRDVRNAKFVTEVIPNADLFVTREDIEKYNIHIVVCSEEYFDEKDDLKGYYKVPRDMGILRVLPYSKEISTSDLIKRIASRNTLENKQKNDNVSFV